MLDKYPNFRSEVREIILRDLILETDVPYIQPGEPVDVFPLLQRTFLPKWRPFWYHCRRGGRYYLSQRARGVSSQKMPDQK